MDLEKDAVRRVFELEKTAVNQNALAERIAENLSSHPLNAPNSWPTFALRSALEPHEAASTSDLLLAVEQATKAYDKIWLDLAIPASDNSFLARIKRPFHQLVLFYVNKLGQKQIKYNDRLLRAVHQLLAAEAKKDAEIQALRAQLTDLQARIEAMENKQA